MQFRLVAYAPGGAQLGFLAEPLSVEASFVYGDLGALSLTYSTLAQGGPLLRRGLDAGLEIAVEQLTPAGWVEPRSGRFLLLKREVDPTDEHQSVKVTCPSFGWMLGKAANLSTANLEPQGATNAGQRKIAGPVSAGGVMRLLWDEYAGRSKAPMPVDMSAVKADADANGRPWVSRASEQYYPVGVKLSEVLRGLASGDLCDWWFEGRKLVMVNPDTGSVDRSASVVLNFGRDLSDAPTTETLEELASRVMATGDQGVTAIAEAPAPVTPWGDWEDTISSGGVTDAGTLKGIASAHATRRQRVTGQLTRTLTGVEPAPLPLYDYQPGDWISAPDQWGDLGKQRLQQVTISMDSSGVWRGSIIVSDRIVAAELRRAQNLAAVGGGTQAGGSGSAPTPPPSAPAAPVNEAPKPGPPKAPTVVSELKLTRAGAYVTQVTATVDPVLIATGSGSTSPEGYELWAQPTDTPGAEWRLVATSVSPSDTFHESVSWTPAGDPGSAWAFKVRALLLDKRGDFSPVVQHTIIQDTAAPGRPTAPLVGSLPSALSIRWDGKLADGGPVPADMRVVEAHVATVAGFTPGASTLVASISSKLGGTVTAEGLTNGTTYYVQLVMVDAAGNRSPASGEVSAKPRSLLESELDGSVVAKIKAATDKADQASLDAAAANNKAADAQTAAANAAGVRDVLIQTAAPTGRADLLWIDITGGANTPKRWNGSAWVAITDKAATDAAAAAAAAKTAADQAATKAGTAQSSADAAKSAADAAATKAATAQTSADTAKSAADQAKSDAASAAGIAGGKADVLIQSTTPAAAMQKATTLWIDTTNGANAPKRWNGSSWVQVTDKAATDAAAAAATAQSAASAAQATANQAKTDAAAAKSAADQAQTTATQALNSANGKNAIITSTAAASGTTNPTTGQALVVGDVWWQWDNATSRNVIGQWRWNGAGWQTTTIDSAVISNLDVNKLTVSGSAHMAQAVIQKLFAEAGYFNTLTADLIRTGSLSAGVKIIGGDVAGAHVELTADGLRIYAMADAPYLAGSFVTGQANQLAFEDADGNVSVSISEKGDIAGQSASFASLSVGGVDLQALLDRQARGVVSYGSRTTTVPDLGTTEMGVLELQAVLQPGRFYRVYTSPVRYYVASSGSNDRGSLGLRVAWDGAAVNTSSSEVIRYQVMQPYATGAGLIPGPVMSAIVSSWNWAAPREIRFLITGLSVSGAAFRIYAPIDIFIEDIGAAVTDTGIDWSNTAAAKSQFTSVWNCTDSAAYSAQNTKRTDIKELRQGSHPDASVAGSYGNHHSLVCFGGGAVSGETGKTVSSALSGAVIRKAELILYVDAWYASTGGTLYVRPSTLTTAPSSLAAPSGNPLRAVWNTRNGTLAIDVTSIAATTMRGFTLGKATQGNYGPEYAYRIAGHQWSNATQRPQLRITYSR